MSNVQDARREMTKTKEQLEEEKRISLSIRIKPLDLSEMDSDQVCQGSYLKQCSGFPFNHHPQERRTQCMLIRVSMLSAPM